jgi:ATP-dependent helicase/nuclease subunit A
VSFERFTPPQRLALDLERNVAVRAGAGSGKTQVLAGRYVWAVTAGGSRPEEILAITFTEKAAAEMKARIRRWLGEGEQRLRGARISTIHAFAAALLREHAVTAGLDPAFAILEGAERIVLLRESIEELLSALATEEAEGTPAARWWSGEIPIEQARQALRLACRLHGRAQLVALLRRLIERRELATRWAAATSRLDDAALLARWRASVPDGLAAGRRLVATVSFARALEAIAAARRTAGGRGAEQIDRSLAAVRAIRDGDVLAPAALCEALLRKGGEPRSFGRDPAAPALEALAAQVAPARDDLLIRIDELDAAAAPQLRALAVLAGAALAHYRIRKDERQLLDFDDLGERAAALLRQDRDARQRVRAAFRHLLVDEMQDVSESQWELVRWLATSDEEGRVLRPACLFAVGDEKQSIYRFRGAEVSVFARIQEAVRLANQAVAAPPRVPDGRGQLPARHDGVVTLEDNFRSHAAPVDFTNELFARLFADATEPWEARPQALRAARPGGGEGAASPLPGVELLLAIDAGETGGRTSAAAMAEGGAPTDEDDFLALYAEADRVARYLRSAPFARTADPAARWRDAAVLLPARTHLRAYQDALRRHGVPFVVLGGIGFWQAQEILDAISLLQFLADPRREIELAAVLRSPWLALPDALVYAIARQRGGGLWHKLRAAPAGLLEAAEATEQEAVVRSAALLARWLGLAGRVSASELLLRSLDESGAWAGLAQGLRGPQRVANTHKLLELLRGYEAAGFRALTDVVASLRVLTEEEEREGEAAIEAVGVDAVRILTIHAAKGLEFPVVIVPELGVRFTNEAERLLLDDLGGCVEAALRVPDPADGGRLARPGLWRALALLERRKMDAEMKRLLYVACTRARERLVLSGGVRRTASGSVRAPRRSWLGWLGGLMGLELEQTLTSAPRDVRLGRATCCITDGNALPVFGSGLPAGVRPPLPDVALAEALQAAMMLAEGTPRLRLTPTLARELERCPHKLRLRLCTGEPEFRGGETIDPLAADEERLDARERGTLLHRAMELDAFAARDPDPVVRRLAAEMRVADGRAVAAVAAQVRLFAGSELGRRVARAQPAFAELPFMLSVGELEVSGKIDRLVRDGAEWLVLDWKTDEVTAEAAAAHAQGAGYFTQMRWYAEAARRLVGVPRSAVRTRLYFTQPGVAVEVPGGVTPFEAVPVSALLGGGLPAPTDPQICRTCGYHLRRLCPADRAAEASLAGQPAARGIEP